MNASTTEEKKNTGYPPPFPPLVLPPVPETFEELRSTCNELLEDQSHSDMQIRDGIVELCEGYFKWHLPRTQQELDFYRQCVKERRRNALENPLVELLQFKWVYQNEADERLEEIGSMRGELKRGRGYTESDRKRDERTAENARKAAAKTKSVFESKSRGGKNGAKTRNEEATHDKTKETIRHEVNAMKVDWDKRYPDRHKRGNKDHSDNMIYRTIANMHTKASGDPLYTWETIKSWYTHPKRSKKSGNK